MKRRTYSGSIVRRMVLARRLHMSAFSYGARMHYQALDDKYTHIIVWHRRPT